MFVNFFNPIQIAITKQKKSSTIEQTENKKTNFFIGLDQIQILVENQFSSNQTEFCCVFKIIQ